MLSSRPLFNVPSLFFSDRDNAAGNVSRGKERRVNWSSKQMRVKEWQGNKRPLELGYRAIKYQINECDCCKERATRSKTQNCQKKKWRW
jgi:hypothetical protein